MHRRAKSIAVLALSLALGAFANACAQDSRGVPDSRNADWATPISPSHNLYRITPTLYRSARLQHVDVAQLQELGIKTVVNLRAFHSDDAVLKDSGIGMLRVPINSWDVNDRNIAAALRAIRAAEQQGPVLLHCLHGADRTGTVTAMYRMLYQGWSKQQALDELVHGGYGYHAVWKNMLRYLREVDLDAMRSSVEQG